jgi:hypothetical protein
MGKAMDFHRDIVVRSGEVIGVGPPVPDGAVLAQGDKAVRPTEGSHRHYPGQPVHLDRHITAQTRGAVAELAAVVDAVLPKERLPAALPWLPSRTGFVTPGAGLMVRGAADDVPEVATDQLPT